MNRSICFSCGKPYNEDSIKCECGCRSMVVGSNYHIEGTKVTCGCGNERIRFNRSLNFEDHHLTVYKCSKCDNCISVYTTKK